MNFDFCLKDFCSYCVVSEDKIIKLREIKMNKYFEYNDNTANSHKFWQISQKSKNVTVSYGRIGIANPHQIVKEFDNKDLALAFAEKKIEEKQKKGYLQV
tara:strand:+ start:341 stop:640 length:300 start_codon:yes stop_codon:yes gene_type:complete